MTTKLPLTTLLLLTLIFSSSGNAAYNFNPELKWQTLSTPHFHFHFHDGLEPIARKAATLAEEIHPQLSKRLNWEPKQATHVVLSDRVDFTNGWARSFPYNLITLYLTPPRSDSSLAEFDDWLRLLIEHEYTHILHLDKAYGLPKFFRYAFGRFPFLFPNMYQPPWILEGLATYIETKKDKQIGRGQASYFEMLMRLEMESGLKPLSQVNLPISSWPGGTTRYLYGVYFFQFLAEKYGEEKILAFVDEYSDNLAPFFLNTTSNQIFRKSFAQLWQEFDIYLLEKFTPHNQVIRSQDLTVAERLTDEGYRLGQIELDESGNLYYLQNDGKTYSRLMVLKKGSDQPEKLLETRAQQFDYHPQKGFVIVKQDLQHNTDSFSDLQHFDPETKKLTQLTEGKRYLEARWSTDGQQLIALHNSLSKSALHKLDANGKYLETLWQGGMDEIISHIDLSPDGRKLVASRWLANTRWQLALFSLEKKTWSTLTNTIEIETQPRFSDDGSSIHFSADYQGVFNLHSISLIDKQLTTHTHLYGGGFYPAMDYNRNTLFYVGQHAEGSDLYRLKLDHKLPSSSPRNQEELITRTSKPYEGETETYSPFHSLLPTWWFPIIQSGSNNRYGLTTFNFDALQTHQYSLFAAYDTDRDQYLGSLSYLYDVWLPAIKLNLTQVPLSYQDSSGNQIFQRQYEQLAGEVVFPFLKEQQQWHLHLGASREREYDLKDSPSPTPGVINIESLLGLGLSYNSSHYYPQAITQKDGRQVTITAESGSYLQGDYPGESFKLDWKEFVSLSPQHTLAMRVTAAQSSDTRRSYYLGGEFGQFELPLAQVGIARPLNGLFNKRSFPLRGYPQGLNELAGHNMALLNMEWRFPIATTERGIMAPPLGLGKWQGTLFYNSGAAWDANSTAEIKHGAGFEIGMDLVVAYNLTLPYRFGYAKGFQIGGEEIAYITVGRSF